jgi:hypothetical protein
MPQFSQQDGRLFVSCVTGPSHIRLGLSFDSNASKPTLVKAPAIGEGIHAPLDEEQILTAVNKGIAKAAEDSGSALHLSELVYIENDSPNYHLFGYCAYLISRRFLNNEPFPLASPRHG